MRHILIVFLLSLFSFASYSQNLFVNVDKQALLTPKRGITPNLVEAFFEFEDAKLVQYYNQLNIYLIEYQGSYNEFENVAKRSNLFSIIEQDKIHQGTLEYTPNDPQFSSCWHLKQSTDKDIDADEAWDLLPANNSYVTVAVFDGGLETTHPDMINAWNNPYNAVTNVTSAAFVNAYDRHGNACAGTIAAVTNNAVGISSIGNNKVQVMPINIMSSVSSTGTFTTSTSIQVNAVNAAMNNPTCVAISMSYGSTSGSSTLSNAFATARTQGRGGKGLVIFASTGNNGVNNSSQYPAIYPDVWGVGATTSTDFRASYSNFGTICDISAPGSSIRTIDRLGANGYNTTDYTTISGTSFSCPITAAAAALIIYKNWELTSDGVFNILAQSCEKVGGYVYSNVNGYTYGTRSNELGYGRINLKTAITLTPSSGGTPPPPPAPKHNLVIQNAAASPNPTNIGTTITISCSAVTLNPTLEQVTSILQYRQSLNNVWGDSDDIIIGTDTTILGGGIGSGFETINYPITGVAGARYILIKANHNGTISESFDGDNVAAVLLTVTDPNYTGTNVKVELNTPLTNPYTTSAQTLSMQWRVTNLGATAITQIGYNRGWVNCPTVTNCTTSIVWTGTLLPGQSTLLPASNSFISVNLCFSSTNCAVPAGGSNIYRLNIVSVNGVTGDDNLSDNTIDLVVNRVTTNDISWTTEYYDITGFIRPEKEFDSLPSGLYFVKKIYSDGHIEVTKVAR